MKFKNHFIFFSFMVNIFNSKKKIQRNIEKYNLQRNISELMNYVFTDKYDLALYYSNMIEENFTLKKGSMHEYLYLWLKAKIYENYDEKKHISISLEIYNNLYDHPAIENDEERKNEIKMSIEKIKKKLNRIVLAPTKKSPP